MLVYALYSHKCGSYTVVVFRVSHKHKSADAILFSHDCGIILIRVCLQRAYF